MSDVTLDPILMCRLDLLGEAAAETAGVIRAMAVQRGRLERVRNCLRPGGLLNSLEDDLKTAVGDVGVRLGVLDAAVVDGLTEAQRKRLSDAYGLVEKAKAALSKIAEHRAEGDTFFKGVRDWSVAALLEEPLNKASNHYQLALRSIRMSPQPWTDYHAAFYGPVHELFSAYLELLGGMAMRGWTARTDGFGDIAARIHQRVDPYASEIRPAARSPLAPMCMRQHLPLGYESWNLWAMPLIAHDVSRELVSNTRFRKTVPPHLHPICADIYSCYVLGPSYPLAAVFLGLDPIDPGDQRRAGVLLEHLVAFTVDTDAAEWIAERAAELTDTWAGAVRAVGASPIELGDDDRADVKAFVEEVDELFAEQRFAGDSLSDIDAGVAYLTGETGAGSDNLGPDDLLTAMWVARLRHPGKARTIHERARELARDSTTTTRIDVGGPRASTGFGGSPLFGDGGR